MTQSGSTLLRLLAVGIFLAQGDLVQSENERSNKVENSRRLIVCGKLGISDRKIELVKGDTTTNSQPYRGLFPWTAALGYQYTFLANSNEPVQQSVSDESSIESQPSYHADFRPLNSPPKNMSDVYWKCGGSLVTDIHVVTSAYCVVNTGRFVLSVVRLGDINLDDTVEDGTTPVNYQIDTWTAHPKFSTSPKVNDIAVIKLKRHVTFTDTIQPICLPLLGTFNTYNFTGYPADITGWGKTSFGGPKQTRLQNARVLILDQQVCREIYKGTEGVIIDHRVVCAGGNNGMNTCEGDAGGPLAILNPLTASFYLYGVVTYGYKCGEAGHPGVYTRVSEYTDFIVESIKAEYVIL